jgi:hypothetical protein
MPEAHDYRNGNLRKSCCTGHLLQGKVLRDTALNARLGCDTTLTDLSGSSNKGAQRVLKKSQA